MAHVKQQPNQPDTETVKGVRVEKGKSGRGARNDRSQSELDAQAQTFSPSAEESGLEIGGFPWQFVLVMAVIGIGLVGMILKLIGVV